MSCPLMEVTHVVNLQQKYFYYFQKTAFLQFIKNFDYVGKRLKNGWFDVTMSNSLRACLVPSDDHKRKHKAVNSECSETFPAWANE